MKGLKLIRRMESEGLLKFLPVSELPIGTLDAALLLNSRLGEILKGKWRGPHFNEKFGPINRDVEFDGEYITLTFEMHGDTGQWLD